MAFIASLISIANPLVVVLFLVLLGYVLKLKTSKTSYDSTKVPGPFAWPVFGNLLSLGKKPHEYLTYLRSVYGDVYKIKMGSRDTIVLNGLQTIKTAMIKQAEDFAGRPNFYSFNYIAKGKSMGFSDYGPRWKLHRKIAQNSLAMFTNKRNSPIEEAIIAEAEVLANNFLNTDGSPMNPHNEIYLSVGNIICALCFGKRYKRDDPDFMQLIKNNDEFMAFAGAGNPVDIMPWMRHFTKRSFNKFVSILDAMDEFTMKKRREHLDTFDPMHLRDVTDALIKTTEDISEEEKQSVGLTDEHILITVQEMIGAGFDTIASTLQWAVLFIATHPEHQDKAYEEIQSVIGSERYPEFEDIASLPFTEACIIEVMRHSCIFPFALPHSSTRDTNLNGYEIPAKSLVFVNLWSVNYDPTIFPDPGKYDPYRFLSDNGKSVNRSAAELFLPFGAGRRKCPGEQLAKMELFIFFTTLLQRCRFDVIPGKEPVVDSKYGLTLKPKDFEVSVSRR
ncbi:hypothetical protein FSP39_021039 [Pinctada imbricata]|uniref:unspecific monooxygenase n=1 Tax=Pinctada imbricata TaxID=66713 RepID=A0AA89BTD6_PINIB|nr:hypothetical protein FSP39_021039 [Pinctada imbricata]